MRDVVPGSASVPHRKTSISMRELDPPSSYRSAFAEPSQSQDVECRGPTDHANGIAHALCWSMLPVGPSYLVGPCYLLGHVTVGGKANAGRRSAAEPQGDSNGDRTAAGHRR